MKAAGLPDDETQGTVDQRTLAEMQRLAGDLMDLLSALQEAVNAPEPQQDPQALRREIQAVLARLEVLLPPEHAPADPVEPA